MIIIGLDPGIGRTGFGIIAVSPIRYLAAGCLTTPAADTLDQRLATLGRDLIALLKRYRPHQAVIEDIFFGANTKTAMATAQARGALLYVLRQQHVSISHLTPLQIKSRLTGHGRADKHQVQAIVTARLCLTAPPQPDDAADALAAALCLADTVGTRLKEPT